VVVVVVLVVVGIYNTLDINKTNAKVYYCMSPFLFYIRISKLCERNDVYKRLTTIDRNMSFQRTVLDLQ